MIWRTAKELNRPLDSELAELREWPNTITTAIALRMRYDGYAEFPEPLPVEHWDYPNMVEAHIEKMYPHMKNKTILEIPLDEIAD